MATATPTDRLFQRQSARQKKAAFFAKCFLALESITFRIMWVRERESRVWMNSERVHTKI